jgi:hypothetical protein
MSVYGRSVLVHRLSFELHFGSIPGGLLVLHKCDVKRCVRPSHLFLGTDADNHSDAKAKGRLPTGENHVSSKLTEAEVKEIRRLIGAGESKTSVGKKFSISRQHAGKIARGERWQATTIF